MKKYLLTLYDGEEAFFSIKLQGTKEWAEEQAALYINRYWKRTTSYDLVVIA